MATPTAIPECSYIDGNVAPDTRNMFNVMSFNINSCNTNFTRFQVELLQGIGLYDVIGLCETHLTDDVEQLYQLDNYTLFTNNCRSDKGGVCLYVSNRYFARVRHDLCIMMDHFETVFIEAEFNGNKVILGMVYRRDLDFQQFLNDFEGVLEKTNSERLPCIIMGDFNVDILKYETKQFVDDYLSLFYSHGFTPLITKPTRVCGSSATLIDNIWCNMPDKVNKANIIMSDVTDHFPVTISMNIQKQVRNDKYTIIRYRLKGSENDGNFSRMLSETNWESVLSETSCNDAFEKLNDKLCKLYNECYPIVERKVKPNT